VKGYGSNSKSNIFLSVGADFPRMKSELGSIKSRLGILSPVNSEFLVCGHWLSDLGGRDWPQVVADNIKMLKQIFDKEEVSLHMSGTEAVMSAIYQACLASCRLLAWLPAWLPGCLDAWLPGCLAVWLSGFLAWLPAFLLTCLAGLASWPLGLLSCLPASF
jgi:hypothetical protein